MNRIEFSWSEDHFARCDCYTNGRHITVLFAPVTVFPMPSELLRIDHPLFSFHLRSEE